jgi:hypothetical protein
LGPHAAYLENADYHAAVDKWLLRFRPRTVFCFIQFKGKSLSEMPDAYLATPSEVANRLRETRGGAGHTILYTHQEWGPRALAAGSVDAIPEAWRFALERIEQLFAKA